MPGPELKAHLARINATHPDIHSMSQLAKAAGITQRRLTRWFSGDARPRTEELSKVVAALGVSLAELWDAYGVEVTRPDEARIADLIQAAYERGFERGFAAGLRAADGPAGSRALPR